MVIELPAVVRTVEAHFRPGAIGTRVQFLNLLEAHNRGPEGVRLFDIPDVQHQVIDSPYLCHGLTGRRWVEVILGHKGSPLPVHFPWAIALHSCRHDTQPAAALASVLLQPSGHVLSQTR